VYVTDDAELVLVLVEWRGLSGGSIHPSARLALNLFAVYSVRFGHHRFLLFLGNSLCICLFIIMAVIKFWRAPFLTR
jgi:hypothetical protein